MSNGKLCLLKDDRDENPVVLDTGMTICGGRWAPDGGTIAVAGSQTVGGQGYATVRFYSQRGQPVHSLRLPGASANLQALAWEGSGLRLVMCVDNYLYFATVRPGYLWTYFARTVLYCYSKPDR